MGYETKKHMFNKKNISSVLWNLFLITSGSLLSTISIKSVAIPHGFLPGGLTGLGSLLYYLTGNLDPSIWYFFLNIPVIIIGYFFISHRFFFYTLYGAVIFPILYEFISVPIIIDSQYYAIVISGVLSGAGTGIILRSMGSGGGIDIIAIILNQRLGIGIGKTSFFYNAGLFGFSIPALGLDRVVASLVNTFISANMMEYVISMFNKRKVVLIISNKSSNIAEGIMKRLNRSATFIEGYGAYSGVKKDILLTVINNMQLKQLEDITFANDPDAFFIVENTFSVVGHGFSNRDHY